MKKGLFVLFCLFFALNVWSLNYCQTSAWGYGGAATGGGNATPTLVNSYAALKAAMGSGNKVIIITQNITFSSAIACSKSNLTILALPGVKLTAENKNIGFFSFKSCSNIIVRNIYFVGKGSDTQQKGDAMTFDGVTTGWVDHCTFQDGSDGNFDIVGLSDNITVSWCRFRYTLGGEHCFSNLIASNSNQKPTDGTYNITFAYCWWDHGCQQRMARSRNASIHYLNSYWNSSDAAYYIGPENTDVYVEGCYFEGAPAKKNVIWANWGGTNGATIKDSYSQNGFPSITGRTVTVPSYTYSAVDYTTTKTMVTHSTCGAGPTLTVTNTGAISSSCDSPDPGPGPGPTPGPDTTKTATTFWNFSDAAFSSLGTLTATQTINGLTIAAAGTDASVTVDGNSKSIDGYNFTSRLKTGGAMTDSARSLSFAVTGNCTIEIYCMSSNSSSTRTMNVATGTWSNTKQTFEVGTTIAKYTYKYTGAANTVYIGSANGGINFYAIKVIYPSTALGEADTHDQPTKILRNDQLFIFNNGHYYTLQGVLLN